MESDTATSSGLYALILGAHWHELAENVRRLHDARGVHAAGTFRVRRGNRLTSLVAWFARLPAACDAVDVRLTVTPSQQREEWHRLFAGTPFTTIQSARGCCLMERAGPAEMDMQLEVRDGALHYRTLHVALCLGPFRLPLPGWLAPRVTGSETPEGAAVRVHVDVVLPLVGLLIAYDGDLTSIEARPC